MGNSCRSVFSSTRAWEHQECNKIKSRMEKARRARRVSMEKSKAGTKKMKYQPPITTLSKYNINKHNMVVFCRKWKKYNVNKVTKNRMDLNNRKMKNYPPSPYLVNK